MKDSKWAQQVKTRKNGCVLIDFLPIGSQTAGPNGLKFGMVAGMDRGTVSGFV